MKKLLPTILLLFVFSISFSQVAINDNGTAPNSNTMLDINYSGTNYKGILIPRMTTAQRTGTFDNSFGASEEGLTVYDTDLNCFFLFDGSNWQRFAMGLNTDDQNISGSGLSGNTLTIGIENGSNETVDLSHFMDNTDDQNIQGSSVSGNNLIIGIENGSSQTVDLSHFMDNTDNQNISGSGLSGNTLTIGIENGANETVDLSSLVDWKLTGNTGTIAGTNFIGTTDAQDLVFKVNSNERFRMTQKGQLYTNSSSSVLIGNGAGDSDDLTDNQNTYIGYNAGQNNSSYGHNTFVGYNAGQNSDHYYSVFIGYEAGKSATNSSGSYDNVFIGRWAGRTYHGHTSVAIGQNAFGNANTNGFGNNVGIGCDAGANSNAYQAVIIGLNAGNTANGINSVIIGYDAGKNSNGNDNVMIGASTCNGVTVSGGQNTLIGSLSTLSNGAYSNSGAFGYQASAGGTGQINIGNASVGTIGGQVGWSTFSDKRIKNNIKENVVGLDFIMKLRPVTYNFDIDKENKIRGIVDTLDYSGKYKNNSTVFTGFIAQEVEQAANDCNYDFDGVHSPANDKDLYSLRYAEFVVPLVKAMQEQQEQIQQLQKQVQQQQQTIDSLINK